MGVEEIHQFYCWLVSTKGPAKMVLCISTLVDLKIKGMQISCWAMEDVDVHVDGGVWSSRDIESD